MSNEQAALAVFEKHPIRRFYDESGEMWYFSVVDVVAALTDSVNARDYWFKMKIRVKTEDGFELSTICRQLKLRAPDGKMRETDCANVEGLFRIIQSIPSPKAEPFKQWLAKVGYERIQDMSDPARSLDRAREYWQQHGRSEKWIQQRMMGQETRNKQRKTPRPAARAAALPRKRAGNWSRRRAGAWSPARVSCRRRGTSGRLVGRDEDGKGERRYQAVCARGSRRLTRGVGNDSDLEMGSTWNWPNSCGFRRH